jgi:hypothetical protein
MVLPRVRHLRSDSREKPSQQVRRFLRGLLIPHSLVVARNLRHRAERDRILAETASSLRRDRSPWTVDEAVRFLVARGVDERQIRDGSIPQASLDFVEALLMRELPSDRPLVALHVGNFVGVSLAHLTQVLRKVHPDSLVVAVDPNVKHRHVRRPAEHVAALLDHFDLLASVVMVVGYTLHQGLGEGWEIDARATYQAERRCEQVLPNLARLARGRFDVAVVDGNHDGRYLARELAIIIELLSCRGLVILDDVVEGTFDEIVDVFRSTVNGAMNEIGRDGRVGVLRAVDTGLPEGGRGRHRSRSRSSSGSGA